MTHALCWALVYLARALEWARLHWNDTWVGERSPIARWTTKELRVRSMRCWLLTPLGRVLIFPFEWMAPAARWLVVLANRGLPPLSPDEGFLRRLHP